MPFRSSQLWAEVWAYWQNHIEFLSPLLFLQRQLVWCVCLCVCVELMMSLRQISLPVSPTLSPSSGPEPGPRAARHRDEGGLRALGGRQHRGPGGRRTLPQLLLLRTLPRGRQEQHLHVSTAPAHRSSPLILTCLCVCVCV